MAATVNTPHYLLDQAKRRLKPTPVTVPGMGAVEKRLKHKQWDEFTLAEPPAGSDLKPVQGHDGMAIHPVQHQRMTPLGPRGQVEVTRGQPFAFVDPVQTDLAVAPIGIVDQPRRQQCRMDIAGKVDGQPFIPANPAEAPAAIQHQITCRKTLVIHGAVLSAVSAGGMDLTMHPISPIPFC